MPKRLPASKAPPASDAGAWWQTWRAGALVGVVALLVRILHLVDFTRLPIFERPTVDALLYVDFARRFAATGELPEVFFKPPLFPVALGAWWNVVGESWFWLRLPFAVLGAGTAVLTWCIARRVFTPGVALVAGSLYALHAGAVYFEGELLEMGLVTFVHTAAFLLVLRSDASPRRVTAFVSGVALGVGIVARPTFVVFALLAIAMLGRRRLAWGVLGVCAAVAPVTLHNAVRGGDFVVVSSNLGMNFYIGNNPNANGRIVSTPELPAEPARARREAQRIAEIDAQRELPPSAVSRYWLRRGVEYAFAQPVRTARNLVRKMYFLWSGTPLSDNEDLLSLPRYLRVYALLPVGMWLLAPLGLAGLVLSRGAASPRGVWWARNFVVASVLAVWPFFVVERFRLPWTPILALFAAWLLVELGVRIRRRARAALPLALVALVLLAACNVPLFGVRQPPALDLDYKVAYAYHQRGDIDAALRAYRSAVERNPRAALARNALGYLMAERGENLDEAARLVREALSIDAQHAANFAESLAFVELRRDDPEAARAACDLGLASAPPGRTRTLLHLRRAEALRRLGELDGAARDARSALDSAASGDLRLQAQDLLRAIEASPTKP